MNLMICKSSAHLCHFRGRSGNPACAARWTSSDGTSRVPGMEAVYGRQRPDSRLPPGGGGSLVGDPYRAGGTRTRLMTWMTPLDAITSGVVTFAPFTNTFVPETRMRTLWPFSVLADDSFTTSAAATLPETTWYRSTAFSFALSRKSMFSVLVGTFLNAASVGANTVYGPDCWSVPASPARFSSFASVLNCPAATAVCTMF